MDQRVRVCGRVVFFCSLLCLCWSEDKVVYVAEGGTLHLQHGVSGHFTSVVWKFNTNLVAEWDAGSKTIYYEKFKGRATLNETTGELHVSRVTARDLVGNFTVDLNNTADAATIAARVLDPVPQPEIHPSPLACSDSSARCTLHCGGDTSKAEPVAFQWEHNPNENNRSVVIDMSIGHVKSFSCIMRNPISAKESQPFKNPFYQENSIGPGGVAGLVCMGLVVLGGVVGAVWFYKKKRSSLNVSEEPPPARAGAEEEVPMQPNA